MLARLQRGVFPGTRLGDRVPKRPLDGILDVPDCRRGLARDECMWGGSMGEGRLSYGACTAELVWNEDRRLRDCDGDMGRPGVPGGMETVRI